MAPPKLSRLFAFFAFAAFLLPLAFSACEIDSTKSQTFDVIFVMNDSFSADAYLKITLPYTEECLLSQGVAKESFAAFDCSENIAYIKDAFFKGVGLLSTPGGSCTASFSEGTLSMGFKTPIEMQTVMVGENSYEMSFKEWRFVQDESASSLLIIVPPGAQITSYYPMTSPIPSVDYARGRVSWEPIPMMKPTIKYSLVSYMWIVWLLCIVVIFAAAAVAYLYLRTRKERAVIGKIRVLKTKMAVLEQDFLRRKMDETTYRRLMEAYQLQLNDLKAEHAKMKSMERIEPKKLKE